MTLPLLVALDPGVTSSPTDAASAVTLVTAGDIACDPSANSSDPRVCQHAATAELLAGADAVLPLGDLQYPDGTLEQLGS